MSTEVCLNCGRPDEFTGPCSCLHEPMLDCHDEHYSLEELEPIHLQEIVGERLDKTDLTYSQKHSVIAALKYARRIGKKTGEDVEKEADKIANYLYRAITGRWIGRDK